MFRALLPHSVTVLTTDRCTAECRHCCMNSSPSRTNTLTYEQMAQSLGQLFEGYRMSVVVFAGGEPTLLGDDLLKAIRFCKDHGVITRIVSNSYWATSPEAALEKCQELRAAGLDELNLSMDDYHEPYVPLERVRWAYQAALQVDFSAIVIANACGPQSVLSPEFLEAEFGMSKTPIQRRFDVDGRSSNYSREEDGRVILMSNGNVQRLGRGAEFIALDECNTDTLENHVDQIGGCPHAVRSLAISPGNHLVSCCGFELHGNPILDFGDLDHASAGSLLDKADDDLLVNMISMVGPPKIKQILEGLCPDEISFPKTNYQSYCEVCNDLVGIEKNRLALYKYQSMFVDSILKARAEQEALPADKRSTHYNLRLTLATGQIEHVPKAL
jgi:hypothetical protein